MKRLEASTNNFSPASLACAHDHHEMQLSVFSKEKSSPQKSERAFNISRSIIQSSKGESLELKLLL